MASPIIYIPFDLKMVVPGHQDKFNNGRYTSTTAFTRDMIMPAYQSRFDDGGHYAGHDLKPEQQRYEPIICNFIHAFGVVPGCTCNCTCMTNGECNGSCPHQQSCLLLKYGHTVECETLEKNFFMVHCDFNFTEENEVRTETTVTETENSVFSISTKIIDKRSNRTDTMQWTRTLEELKDMRQVEKICKAVFESAKPL